MTHKPIKFWYKTSDDVLNVQSKNRAGWLLLFCCLPTTSPVRQRTKLPGYLEASEHE